MDKEFPGWHRVKDITQSEYDPCLFVFTFYCGLQFVVKNERLKNQPNVEFLINESVEINYNPDGSARIKFLNK